VKLNPLETPAGFFFAPCPFLDLALKPGRQVFILRKRNFEVRLVLIRR
jgi:hypothetical protein